MDNVIYLDPMDDPLWDEAAALLWGYESDGIPVVLAPDSPLARMAHRMVHDVPIFDSDSLAQLWTTLTPDQQEEARRCSVEAAEVVHGTPCTRRETNNALNWILRGIEQGATPPWGPSEAP